MISKFAAPAFYLGTLVSSVGSMTFNVCLIAFMIKAGFGLADASLIIGLQRLIPVIVTALWGQHTDHLSPRRTVIACELVAALSSILLLQIWGGPNSHYESILVLCVLRAVVVSFQTGSRTKLAKQLSDGTYSGNSKHAIWFNKATQGATLFSGLIAWFIIQNFSLEMAIVFDAVTFFISGFAVLAFAPKGDGEQPPVVDQIWTEKFRNLFKYNPRAALLDLILAASMMGTVAFMARMADGDQTWTGKFMASYGAAVWLAGFLERKITCRISTAPFWIAMSISFAILGLLGAPSWLALFVFFVKDLCYWIILHRISSYIQNDSPSALVGSISSARTSAMISILAVGEILVGAWSGVVPLWLEGAARACVLFVIALYLVTPNFKQVVLNDRPAL